MADFGVLIGYGGGKDIRIIDLALLECRVRQIGIGEIRAIEHTFCEVRPVQVGTRKISVREIAL